MSKRYNIALAADIIERGQFMRDELEAAGIIDKPKPYDLRVMKTLLSLHCRIDRLEADVRLANRSANRSWWDRLFHRECR